MEYKISVVIPFYNCEKCIKRAIDSVLNQNRNDVLIILSDDGSTDKSIKICEEYVQKYQNINRRQRGSSFRRAEALVLSGVLVYNLIHHGHSAARLSAGGTNQWPDTPTNSS